VIRSPPLPPGPNPHAKDPPHVAPFGKVWAVVENLGVISTHRQKAEAEAALSDYLARRRQTRPMNDIAHVVDYYMHRYALSETELWRVYCPFHNVTRIECECFPSRDW
jgi:hypothetical protein